MEDLDLKIENPRVRMAPSPTGPLHIGTARTALFNFLFAKKYNGKFILRIEDTDTKRSEEKWERDIIEGLQWLGIYWDEGPDPETLDDVGNFGPYHQSKRSKLYQKYTEKLLKEGKAYYCFCTQEDLEVKKQYLMSIGQPPRYDGTCRNLTKKEVENNIGQGKNYVIRFKMPNKEISFNDMLHGKVSINLLTIGDIVIAKSVSQPLYNLAAVIDDHEMQINHVIRGEDHISNTPKQIALYEALGIKHPEYAHIPLILGSDRTKLSKRHGSTAISEYREAGYLPEALINLLAFLGWNPDNDREIYSLKQLNNDFSLERCQKSAAVFNSQKLIWLNGFYIRQKNLSKLTELCIPYLIEEKLIKPIIEREKIPPVFGADVVKQKFTIIDSKEIIEIEEIERMVSLYQERLKVLSEIVELIDFFFKKELGYKKNLLMWKDMDDKELKEVLAVIEKTLSEIDIKDWKSNELQEVLLKKSEKFKEGKDRGYLLWPLRAALTGKKSSASPFDICELLGKEKSLERIRWALELITN